MNDGYGDLGKMIGFCIGRFVEKKWIRFEPRKDSPLHAVLCLLGLIPIVKMKQFLRPVIVGLFGSHWGKLWFSVLYAFYAIALFPLVLKLIGSRKKE